MAFSRFAESSVRAPWLVAVATMAADAAIAKMRINVRSLVLFMSILHVGREQSGHAAKSPLDIDQGPNPTMVGFRPQRGNATRFSSPQRTLVAFQNCATDGENPMPSLRQE